MISVCIATYNGEHYIKSQLQSILSQIGADDEIIISDADSNDNTITVIKSLNDSRIKIYNFTQDKDLNRGNKFYIVDRIRSNFENALSHAKGDVIFMADQDDIWCTNKVTETCKELKSCSLVLHDCSLIDAKGNQFRESVFATEKIYRNIFGMFFKSPFMGCCMAFHRSVLERALPFPNLHIEYDTWIGICAYKIGHVAFLNQQLIQYRRHGNNASTSSGKSENPLMFKIIRRIYMLMAFIRCQKSQRYVNL